jgi:hypothetical protein
MRLAAVVIIAAACAHPRAPAAPAPTPAIDGLDALIAPGATLVLGEVHGTAESPRFAGDVALAAASRAPTTLALEIPRDEQARVDAYVAGGDRAALLAGPFWHRATQDGRSSAAMLELLTRVRASGGALAVLAYDIAADDPAQTDGQTRDLAMAARVVEARRAAPARTFVVYGGNIHSRRTIGTPWGAAYRPMTWAIADAGVVLTTLDVRASGGAAWVCLMGDDGKPLPCGPHETPAQPVARTWYVERGGADGHDGVYVVGVTTASPPAIR